MGLITYENLEDGQKVTANVFNERFAQIVAQLNGNIDENNLKNASITKEKLKAEVYESMYPIGSMYVNFTDNTNPGALLGFGVWQAVEGRVVVGYDAAQTEFNAAEKTGGVKTVTLTRPQTGWGVSGDESAGFGLQLGSLSFADRIAVTNDVSAHDNLPPYIVGYVWKRIS